MTDIVSPAKRSQMMSGIKSRDTRPEILIRRRLHKLGFRYVLHRKGLPGRPDMVFPKYNAVIFINGCFWHVHHCRFFKWPKSQSRFWENKLAGNKERDLKNVSKLRSSGWRTAIVWECALKEGDMETESVISGLSRWLKSSRNAFETRIVK